MKNTQFLFSFIFFCLTSMHISTFSADKENKTDTQPETDTYKPELTQEIQQDLDTIQNRMLQRRSQGSLLIEAIVQKKKDAARYLVHTQPDLLTQYATYGVPGQRHYMPLQLAIKKMPAIVPDIMKVNETTITMPNHNTQTFPLHIAAQYSDTNIMGLLLAHKAEVNKTNKEGETALFFAKDSAPHVTLLLSQGATISANCLYTCEPAALDLLLPTFQGDINAPVPSMRQETPLLYAIHTANVEVYNKLVIAGAHVVKQATQSPLEYALQLYQKYSVYKEEHGLAFQNSRERMVLCGKDEAYRMVADLAIIIDTIASSPHIPIVALNQIAPTLNENQEKTLKKAMLKKVASQYLIPSLVNIVAEYHGGDIDNDTLTS